MRQVDLSAKAEASGLILYRSGSVYGIHEAADTGRRPLLQTVSIQKVEAFLDGVAYGARHRQSPEAST